MAMLSIVPISWFLGMVPAWFMHPEIQVQHSIIIPR